MASDSGRVLYAWNDAHNATLPFCKEPSSIGTAQCERPSWSGGHDTRELLWAAAVHGQATRVHLAEVYYAVEAAHEGGACNSALEQALNEAHSHDLRVYALLGYSRQSFDEQVVATWVVSWNARCSQHFDGIAVNNEVYTSIKCGEDASSAAQRAAFLDGLYNTTANAGALPVHMSVAWHWSRCDGADFQLSWAPPGVSPVSKTANQHIIDMVQSVDAQVAWNRPDTMVDRARTAGYEYAVAAGKPFYVLAYSNDVEGDCRLSFFPIHEACTYPGWCDGGACEQRAMLDALADVERQLPEGGRGAIHAYGFSYASGVHGFPELPELAPPGTPPSDAAAPPPDSAPSPSPPHAPRLPPSPSPPHAPRLPPSPSPPHAPRLPPSPPLPSPLLSPSRPPLAPAFGTPGLPPSAAPFEAQRPPTAPPRPSWQQTTIALIVGGSAGCLILLGVLCMSYAVRARRERGRRRWHEPSKAAMLYMHNRPPTGAAHKGSAPEAASARCLKFPCDVASPPAAALPRL